VISGDEARRGEGKRGAASVSLSASEPESIEALAKRHRDLERTKIRAEAELRNLEQQLGEAKGEAKRLFGTDDLAELKALLERMREENLRKRRDYQAHLDEIEAGLAAAERAHADAAAESGPR
jgi:TolA-binding protein